MNKTISQNVSIEESYVSTNNLVYIRDVLHVHTTKLVQ